jgi:hypothetical protein
MSNYATIIAGNLAKLFSANIAERAKAMQAEMDRTKLSLIAFGDDMNIGHRMLDIGR